MADQISRSRENMAGFGKELVYCLLAVLLASARADDKVTRDIETKESSNFQKLEASRSGAYYASEEDSLAERADSSKQQRNELFFGPGGAGSAYSYNEQQNENGQHPSHTSQFQQGNLGYGPGYLPQIQYRSQQPNNNPENEVSVRMIPHTEHYWPNRNPGYENIISCRREGELYSFWTPVHDCMMCVCVREGPYLEPVCVNCAGCSNKKPFPVPVPVPITTLHPIYISTTPVPVPVPERVTCSPMPSGTPFQNPLHPCQICICYEGLNSYGEPDVRIECQENPQCVLPPEPLPYVPDEPIPLPKCKKFPNNVLFPHPVEPCKVCKCTVLITPYGPEDHITCFPDPDCVLPPSPVPVPVHIIPAVTVRPSPVPVPVLGPLPGPTPHESCRPYTPNKPFQHPWDECQTCVCIESYSVGVVTIEINCYTNKICCIEPPYDQTVAPYFPTPIPVYPYGSGVPGYQGGAQQISETLIQEQEQPNYALHQQQTQQIGSQVSVPYSYQKPGYNNFITAQPGYGYVAGYGQKQTRVNYGPPSYAQGTFGQSPSFDESEQFDKKFNYDHISYQKGNYASGVYNPSVGQVPGANYGLIGYNGGAYGQSSEFFDKNLNSAQNAHGQGLGNSNILGLKLGPVQLSLRGKTKSADPNKQDASDEEK